MTFLKKSRIISYTQTRKVALMGSLFYLLDKRDLRKQPLELRGICKKIFFHGKGLRSQLSSQIGHILQLSTKEVLFLSRIVEYIHNSSLLHDDFIDHSKTRRNSPTAWLEFSPSQAVLAGDYLLAKVNIYLAQEGNLTLIKQTARALSQLAEGEFLQRELLGFCDKNLKKRDKVSELKTASLFKWCLQAPFIYQRRDRFSLYPLLENLGRQMGLLFQRSDDLMDFSVRNKDKKHCFSDLRQTYFNSFACFLLKNANPRQERELKKLRTLASVHKLFPDFKNRIQAFDQVNSQIIKKGHKEIDRLKPFLKKREKALPALLKSWMYFLYWRQKWDCPDQI